MQLSIGKYHLPNKVTNAEELLFRIFLTKVYYLRIIGKFLFNTKCHKCDLLEDIFLLQRIVSVSQSSKYCTCMPS